MRILTDLPDILVLELLSYLDAPDLFHFLHGVPGYRKVASDSHFIIHFLMQERLPGNSLEDLVQHMVRWEKYKLQLRQGLCRIVFEDESSSRVDEESIKGGANEDEKGKESSVEHTNSLSQERKHEIRTFLRDAIFNFTNRTAGAQPWYEQLPLGPGTGFEFVLDLTANMRRLRAEPTTGSNGDAVVWTELADGDGTRILPTWLSTQDYRREYGFFQFHHLGNNHNITRGTLYHQSSPYLIVQDVHGNQYYVPGSCRPAPVLLTSVLHRAASGLNMYTRILQRTVESGCPEQVLQALTSEMLPSSSWFRHLYLGKQQRLPKQAAQEMYDRARQLLLLRHSQGGASGSGAAVTQALIWTNANQVLLRQQRREWNAISMSLWKLCQSVYGKEWTPSLCEMFGQPVGSGGCSPEDSSLSFEPATRPTSL